MNGGCCMSGYSVRSLACALVASVYFGCTSGNPSENTGARTDPAREQTSTFEMKIEPLAVSAAGPSAQPQLTSSPAGVILSWLEQKGRTSILRFSERKGSTAWSAPQTIASGDDWFVSWADVPS